MLRELLGDLSQQTGILNCQVIVTLNLAHESLSVSDFPGLALTIIRNPSPKGFGANHNAAFQQCASPWFFIVNPDIRLPERSTIQYFTSERNAGITSGIIAPRIVNARGAPEDSVRENLSPWSIAKRVLLRRRAPFEPKESACKGRPFFWVAGMFMAVQSTAFRQVRGFDERFFLYCEDYDLCARLYCAGYAIETTDNVSVIHNAQRDSHRSSRHLRWHVSSLLKVWISRPFWQVSIENMLS